MKRIGIFLLLFTTLLSGQEIKWEEQQGEFSVALHLLNSHIEMVESTELRAEFIYPSSYQINDRTLIENLLWHTNPLKPKWQVVDHSVHTAKDQTGKMNQTHFRVRLAPLEVGELTLSFLNVIFREEESEVVKELWTPIFKISVTPSAIVNVEPRLNLFPLEPRYPIALNTDNRNLHMDPNALAAQAEANRLIFQRHSFPWMFIGIILVGTVIGLLWHYRERKWKIPKFYNPREKALDDLRVIWRNFELNPESYQSYYENLIELVRRYLAEQYLLFTDTKTSQELLQRAQKILPKEVLQLLQPIITQADQVKFADYKPTRDQDRQSYEEVLDLIHIEKYK